MLEELILSSNFGGDGGSKLLPLSANSVYGRVAISKDATPKP